MPRKNWLLNTPKRGFTHVQVTAIKIEVDRSNCDPATAGYVDIWYTFGEKVNGVFVDEDSKGHDYRIQSAEFDTLDATTIPDMNSLIDIEHAVYNFLGSRGIIPPGVLQIR